MFFRASARLHKGKRKYRLWKVIITAYNSESQMNYKEYFRSLLRKTKRKSRGYIERVIKKREQARNEEKERMKKKGWKEKERESKK